jgi:hypothetical protein
MPEGAADSAKIIGCGLTLRKRRDDADYTEVGLLRLPREKGLTCRAARVYNARAGCSSKDFAGFVGPRKRISSALRSLFLKPALDGASHLFISI